jgi:hypothetical protein
MRIEETTFVNVSRWEAFQVAAQPENIPLWNHGVLESNTRGRLGKGAQIVQVARVFGRCFESVYEVTSYLPPRRVTYSSVLGPMDVRGTMEFISKPDGTLLRWTVVGDCRGFLHVGDAVLERVGRREMRACLRKLAELVEATPPPARAV